MNKQRADPRSTIAPDEDHARLEGRLALQTRHAVVASRGARFASDGRRGRSQLAVGLGLLVEIDLEALRNRVETHTAVEVVRLGAMLAGD